MPSLHILQPNLMRRFRHLLPAAVLALAAAGCDTNEVLTVEPTTVVPASGAISDVVSARAAVSGLYDALQSGFYYGESFVNFVELSSDNAIHTGTFSTYAVADNYQNTAENSNIAGVWTALYRSIGRANAVIEALEEPSFVVSPEEQGQMLAEAYFIRALGHHNLTKLWGDVPLVLTTITDPDEASEVTRSSQAEVYTQILADLQAAEDNVTEEPSWTQITQGGIEALRARVLFYQGNYAGALAEANKVIAHGYALAPTYPELFDERGNATSEDIVRVRFVDSDAGSVSYYYMSKGLGGRREVGPSGTSAPSASLPYGGARYAYFFEDSVSGIDLTISQAGASPRRAWNLSNNTSGSSNYIAKFRSVVGTEHIHVIRFAEVLLIKAESQARLNDLAGATATLNIVRARAGLPAKVLGTTNYTSQQNVIDAVIRERRLELFAEGDRWPDLIRLGLADNVASATCQATLGETCDFQQLYPVPASEREVAPNLSQNPGY
jgi:starch-binding outer membrane protein, SusD/RagB family